MKLDIKNHREQIIQNKKSISIITEPNTESKIILINLKKIKILVNKNSKLIVYSYYKNSIITKEVKQEKDSILECYDLSINSKLETKVELNGKNASYSNKNLSISTTDSTINTIVNHNSKETKSYLLNKNLIDKNSFVKCQGKIFIPKESIHCKSQQKFETILLDNTSKCEASPILEIFNDQVSCSHNASISYINTEKLYYLNSRGLNEKTASKLLIEAFAQTILKEMPESIINKAKEELK